MNINIVVINGRLTRDATFKDLGDTKVINFSIANNRRYKDKEGEWHSKTIFRRITHFTKFLDPDKLTQGCEVLVQGSMETDEWTDKDGNEQKMDKINASKVSIVKYPNENKEEPSAEKEFVPPVPEDEDIPF